MKQLQRRFDSETQKVVFWMLHIVNFFLIASMLAVYLFLKKEDIFEIVMAEIFVFSTLFTFLGSKLGAYVGAMMEEDPCGEMDMGVLSAMGAFLGATLFALAGSALVGLYFYVSAFWIHVCMIALILAIFSLSCFFRVQIKRQVPIDHCGCELDEKGNVLPQQPLRMKNKLAVMLGISMIVEVALTLIMIFVMKRDLANQWMLGGMMYGMGGAMAGGLLGGWLGGLMDRHEGTLHCDNPIMVCGMALMGGMMGGMLAGMIGGMNALMGPMTIVPTVVLPVLVGAYFYFWMFRGKFSLNLKTISQNSITKDLAWQKN